MKKIFFLVTIFLLCYFQYRILSPLNIASDLITNIITFLSVVFGFYITSLSIFVTSQYVSNLYKITDKENKTVTLLHTLINNYKVGLIIILISIIYFLSLNLLINQTETKSLLLGDYRTGPVLALMVFNFYYSYKMLSDLTKIILQEAKSKVS